MTVVSTPVNDLLRIAGRAAEITGTYSNSRIAQPERVDELTRAALVVEHVNQEMVTFVHFVYRRAGNGRLLHILSDGQLRPGVWCPWGSSGKSTLTRPARNLVRKWLLAKEAGRLRPPFVYLPQYRRWYVDLKRYPTLEAALAWLERHQLSAGEWVNLY